MKRPLGRPGFTLVEILLSVAILGLLSGVSLVIFRSVQLQSDRGLITADVFELGRRAQARARAVKSDREWGIFVEPNQLTLFPLDLNQSERYGSPSRPRTEDEVLGLPAGVTITAHPTEVIYSKVWGLPFYFPTAESTSPEPLENGTLTVSYPDGSSVEIAVSRYGFSKREIVPVVE